MILAFGLWALLWNAAHALRERAFVSYQVEMDAVRAVLSNPSIV
jgi:hypothetical protein